MQLARGLRLSFYVVLIVTGNLYLLNAQKAGGGPAIKITNNKSADNSLFTSDAVLVLKIEGRLRDLFTDRNDNMTLHPVLLKYFNEEGEDISIHVNAKTRGHFRRNKENCSLPPLLLQFPNTGMIKKTLFKDQKELKVVMPCGDDELVVREYLLYKIYNLFTEKSFRARLVKIDFEDSLKKRKPDTHFCFLIEDAVQLSKRINAARLKTKTVPMKNTDFESFTTMAVFQYMIGNTDWSVPYLQNINLVATNSSAPIPIPYDFDHAGIVRAPYAMPAEELGITNTLVRLYRGYCLEDKAKFAGTIGLFNRLRKNIYDVYTGCNLLSVKYVKATLAYLDDFYKIINNDKLLNKEFDHPCRVTQRIEIKGLKE